MKKALKERSRERRAERFKEVCWTIVISGGLAATSLWLALAAVKDSRLETRQVEARIAHLRTATASDFAGNSPNQEVVIQGRISPLAPIKHPPFAAYVENETVYGEGTSTVKRVDIRPPLLLKTAKGDVTIENYSLEPPSDEKAGTPSYHYCGLTPGQLVVVGGYIGRGAKGPTFQGATVLDPKRFSYASFLRDQVESPVLSVITWSLCAAFCLGLGAVFIWLSGD